MQQCEKHNPEEYPLIFKGRALSSRTLPEETEKIYQDMLQKEPMTREEAELWVGKAQQTKFEILETYKGDAGKQVDVYHGSQSVLGMTFANGEVYIIHASHNQDYHPEEYFVYRCDWEHVKKESKKSAVND